MSETTADILRRMAAELRADTENLPVITLLERLTVPLPEGRFDSIEKAPGWVRTRYDGCPDCLIRDNVPVLWSLIEDGVVCAYHCNRCRSAWWTSWGICGVGMEFAP